MIIAIVSKVTQRNLKEISLIAGTVTAVVAVLAVVIKLYLIGFRHLAKKATAWVKAIISSEVSPVAEALKEHREESKEVSKKVIAILDDIHTATAELMPNGGTKLHDKIVDIAEFLEKSNKG